MGPDNHVFFHWTHHNYVEDLWGFKRFVEKQWKTYTAYPPLPTHFICCQVLAFVSMARTWTLVHHTLSASIWASTAWLIRRCALNFWPTNNLCRYRESWEKFPPAPRTHLDLMDKQLMLIHFLWVLQLVLQTDVVFSYNAQEIVVIFG